MTNKGTVQPNYDASTFITQSYNTDNDALAQVFIGFDGYDDYILDNAFKIFDEEDADALVGFVIKFDKNAPGYILLDIKRTGENHLERIYLDLNYFSIAVEDHNFLKFAVDADAEYENEIIGIFIDFTKDEFNTLDRIFIDCFTDGSFAVDDIFLTFVNDRVQIEGESYGNE